MNIHRALALHGALARRYELETAVGIGPHGTVWRAREIATGAACAVKVVAARYVADDTVRHRFLADAPLLTEFVHPSWVTVREVIGAGAGLALVTDLIGGPTLHHGLARHGPLTAGQAVMLAVTCADALTAAHRRGLEHHNIKLGNILVTDDSPAVRITDARLSWLIRDSRAGRGEPPAPATDVFQLGVVLYQVLSGRLFPGHDLARPLPGSVPESLAALVHACLAPEAADRPTAAELAAQLRAVPYDADAPLRRRYVTGGRAAAVPAVGAVADRPATEPAATEPAALDPAALDPAALDPAAPDPAAEPATAEPATEPVAAGRPAPAPVAGTPPPDRPREPVAPSPVEAPLPPVDGGRPTPTAGKRPRTRYLVSGAALLAVLAGTAVVTATGTPDGAVGAPEAPARPSAVSSVAASFARPLPPQAATRTAEGAQAFVPYWFAALDHALATGDTGPLRAVSAPGCRMCTDVVAKIDTARDRGETIHGAAYVVRSAKPDAFFTLQRPILRVVVDRGTGHLVGPQGPAGGGALPQLTFSSLQLVLTWSDTGWLAADAQAPVPLA